MMKVVRHPNPILRKRSKPVKDWGLAEKKLITDLKKVIKKSRIGVGLSAPQIGVNKRVFIGQKQVFFPKEQEFSIFINPIIEKTFGRKVYPLMADEKGNSEEFLEGCLSFPDLYGPIKRYLKISVSFYQPTGKGNLEKQKAQLEGLGAIVFQHELDHLNGVLFVDYLKKEKKDLYKISKDGERTKIDLKGYARIEDDVFCQAK
ncbi:MAG: peptide deformylase [Candidatus Shapirobacteria bacterium]